MAQDLAPMQFEIWGHGTMGQPWDCPHFPRAQISRKSDLSDGSFHDSASPVRRWAENRAFLIITYWSGKIGCIVESVRAYGSTYARHWARHNFLFFVSGLFLRCGSASELGQGASLGFILKRSWTLTWSHCGPRSRVLWESVLSASTTHGGQHWLEETASGLTF